MDNRILIICVRYTLLLDFSFVDIQWLWAVRKPSLVDITELYFFA